MDVYRKKKKLPEHCFRRVGKTPMVKVKDIHGLINLSIGIALALFAGLYASAMPIAVVIVMGISAFILIFREGMMNGDKKKWSSSSLDKH